MSDNPYESLEPAEDDPDVPDWEDEYIDRVSDRLMFNYDLEKDKSVAGRRFSLYGRMQMHHQKHFLHPALSFAHHDTYDHVFATRIDTVTVSDIESLVALGHEIADDWIETDEEHYATEFTFAVVAESVPESVREFVDGFRERTMLKKGYYGHYEINLVVVAPDDEAVVASEITDLDTAFRLWERLETDENGLLDRLRRRLQV